MKSFTYKALIIIGILFSLFILLSFILNKSQEKALKSSNLSLFDTRLCDGFDFPVGNPEGKGTYISSINGKTYDAWYVATQMGEKYTLGIHTGEDWNGSGGGNTDLGQPVYSTANGTVLYASECPSPWGNVIMIEHAFLENGQFKKVYSQYAHLKEIFVKKGEVVSRRQKIASIGQGNHKEYPAHLHFEIRKECMETYAVDYWPSSNNKDVSWVKKNYESPSEFVKKHRKLLVPTKEKTFVLAEKGKYKMHVYKSGVLKKSFEIALGQQPIGAKEKQGDLKVPEGEYYICEKTQGPFDASVNWSNAYLGPRWLRISYPNDFDAERGVSSKLISKEQLSKISTAIKQKKTPLQNTALGGGIGVHGWIESDWKNEASRALTWGCISMHNKDLIEFYNLVESGTVILIMK